MRAEGVHAVEGKRMTRIVRIVCSGHLDADIQPAIAIDQIVAAATLDDVASSTTKDDVAGTERRDVGADHPIEELLEATDESYVGKQATARTDRANGCGIDVVAGEHVGKFGSR